MIIEETTEVEKDQGFTLVELLIVIVILGILATIVVFAVRGITDQGQAVVLQGDRQDLRGRHRGVLRQVRQRRQPDRRSARGRRPDPQVRRRGNHRHFDHNSFVGRSHRRRQVRRPYAQLIIPFGSESPNPSRGVGALVGFRQYLPASGSALHAVEGTSSR